jgi:hypothetical protein
MIKVISQAHARRLFLTGKAELGLRLPPDEQGRVYRAVTRRDGQPPCVFLVASGDGPDLDTLPGMRVPTDSGARLGDGAPPSTTHQWLGNILVGPLPPPAVQARPLTRDEVTFTITTEAEDLGGSELEDPENTAAIQARIDRGDSDAWCGVIVTASWRGFTGQDSIWGCSLDETYTAAVVADEHGMHDNALQALNESIATALENLAPIILR